MQTGGINPNAIIANYFISNRVYACYSQIPDPNRAGKESEEALVAALIVFSRISGAEDPKAINVTAAISSGTEKSSIIASTAANYLTSMTIISESNFRDLEPDENQQQCKSN